MAKIACMLSLLVLINASTLTLTPQDASAFLAGFFQGLQTDPSVPSVCGGDFQSLNENSIKLIQDVLLMINKQQGSIATIMTDFQTLVQDASPLAADCNFPQLFLALEKVLGPNGYAIIMRNYFKNIQIVSATLQDLQTCGTDYESCGLYAGELFRYLVGFSLGDYVIMVPESAVLGLKTSNYEELILGILKGLQSDPTTDSQCVSDFASLTDKLDEITQDIDALLAGKSGAFVKFITDIKSLEIPNMIEECNIVGLVDQIEVLAGPNGFMTLWVNYAKNQKDINNNLEVLKVCDQDYLTCGEAIGNTFQLLVGWSI